MAQDSDSRKLDQYIVRFPDGMRQALKDAAKENNRSLNAEIIARLEAHEETHIALISSEATAKEMLDMWYKHLKMEAKSKIWRSRSLVDKFATICENAYLANDALDKGDLEVAKKKIKAISVTALSSWQQEVELLQLEENPSSKDNETDTKED